LVFACGSACITIRGERAWRVGGRGETRSEVGEVTTSARDTSAFLAFLNALLAMWAALMVYSLCFPVMWLIFVVQKLILISK
jgi:hypothetical protein